MAEMYEIRVFVETGSAEMVESIADRIGDVVCPPTVHEATGRCSPPWFIVSQKLDEKAVREWRELLNR
jgi:hypothetical protein